MGVMKSKIKMKLSELYGVDPCHFDQNERLTDDQYEMVYNLYQIFEHPQSEQHSAVKIALETAVAAFRDQCNQ